MMELYIGAYKQGDKNRAATTIDDLDKTKHYKVTVTEIKSLRTTQQERAVRKYYQLMADALNNGGYEFEDVLTVPVSWSPDLFKLLIWDKVREAATQKTSNAKMDNEDLNKTYDILNKFFSTKFGLHVPFPDRRG
jgi:hypothetical protein